MDRVFLIGFMGAGKTTIGKALAQIINYRFFDIDDLIEQKTGKTISDIFDKNNEEEFRKFEQQALKEIIACSGTHFDPEIVVAFEKAYQKNKTQWPLSKKLCLSYSS